VPLGLEPGDVAATPPQLATSSPVTTLFFVETLPPVFVETLPPVFVETLPPVFVETFPPVDTLLFVDTLPEVDAAFFVDNRPRVDTLAWAGRVDAAGRPDGRDVVLEVLEVVVLEVVVRRGFAFALAWRRSLTRWRSVTTGPHHRGTRPIHPAAPRCAAAGCTWPRGPTGRAPRP